MYSLTVMYAEDDDANGEYLYYPKQNSYKNINGYILFRKKLSINAYSNTTMWIIGKSNNSTDQCEQILYYCPARESQPIYFVPKTPWECYNKTSETSIPFILTDAKQTDYLRDTLNTNTDGNIFDINVRKAILIDIYKFSGYHSWYKHIPLRGREYILIPKMYGQIRGYHSDNRKIDQIRWHCATTDYATTNNKKLLQICKKYPMKFNCCFGAGNIRIAQRRNEDFETYMKNKYEPLFKYYKEKEKKSKSDIMDMVFNEESWIQIENGVQCGYKIYDEIVQWFKEWISLIVNYFIRNNYNQYRKIPHGILSIVVMFCDIAFPDVFEKKDYSITYIND